MAEGGYLEGIVQLSDVPEVVNGEEKEKWNAKDSQVDLTLQPRIFILLFLRQRRTRKIP